MTLQDQYLAFLYAKQLHDAGILFEDACAFYCVYKYCGLYIKTENKVIALPSGREGDINKLYSYMNNNIAAPNLEELIARLPKRINPEPIQNRLTLRMQDNTIWYYGLQRASIEGLDEITHSDPKIAAAMMLLKLQELGLLNQAE